jgi:hypothetical protein
MNPIPWSQTYRYQRNQGVKAALVRHYVDLSFLNFSTVASTVYLTGSIRKDSKGEFSTVDLEAMLREIVRIPGVHGLQADLDNWMISYTGAGFELHRKTVQSKGQGADKTVQISEFESVRDVLECIRTDDDDEQIG